MEDGKICPELVSRWELENNLSFIHAVMQSCFSIMKNNMKNLDLDKSEQNVFEDNILIIS